MKCLHCNKGQMEIVKSESMRGDYYRCKECHACFEFVGKEYEENLN